MATKRISKTLRTAVFARDGLACLYCLSFENLTLDHVVPSSFGGASEASNLVVCCRSCNGLKADYALRQFVTVLNLSQAEAEALFARVAAALATPV